MQTDTVLVIIDPQNCFMDVPKAPLPVGGATFDMRRLAAFIAANQCAISSTIVSLDTHVPDHISHAVRWLDPEGNHPAPFTIITYEDYERRLWRAANPIDQQWQGEYLRRLLRPHCIWPVHGQKPQWEWQICNELAAVLSNRRYHVVEKGMHRDTEQFGIFGADVPFPGAAETEINLTLIEEINSFGRVIFAGEAQSHCVMDSVNQFLAHIPKTDWSKVVLLEDCMSPVPHVPGGLDFPTLAATWLDDMWAKGVIITKTTDYSIPLQPAK